MITYSVTAHLVEAIKMKTLQFTLIANESRKLEYGINKITEEIKEINFRLQNKIAKIKEALQERSL